MYKATLASVFLLLIGIKIQAADVENPESFRLEFTGSSWLLNTAGNVESSGTVIDFVHDLGFEQQRPTFYGKLVFKPGRKHRIVLEASPLRFEGQNTIHRSIIYQGQAFDVDETLKTNAGLDDVYVGYQYDILSGPAGHLGVSAGGAYMNATATIVSVEAATTASKTQNLGLPLTGIDFRIFPLRSHKWVDIDGEIKGMDFGHYGYFVEGAANAGVWLGPVVVEAGYRVVDSLLQETGADGGGIAVRMRGPIFSLGFKR